MTAPKRTADTMSEAIAISSPNGSMSKRARDTANERLRRALFGDGLQPAPVPQPTEREALLRQASDLRALAAHGVRPRAHIGKAEELEAKAAAIACPVCGKTAQPYCDLPECWLA